MPMRRFVRPLGPALCVLALMLFPVIARAQNTKPPSKGRDISGIVLDVDAKPVGNATVAVTGGGPTATTAPDGSFKLSGAATANLILEITADGFTARQVP